MHEAVPREGRGRDGRERVLGLAGSVRPGGGRRREGGGGRRLGAPRGLGYEGRRSGRVRSCRGRSCSS